MLRFFASAEPATIPPNTLEDIVRLAAENSDQAGIDLRQALENFFNQHTPNELTAYDRPKLLQAMLTQHAWPTAESRPFAAKDGDVWKVKDELLGVMKTILDKNLKVNALLQSLCKDSFLGTIFHYQRGWIKAPSVQAGTLKLITIALEDALLSNPDGRLELLEDTKIALQKELERNPGFNQSLFKYPNIQHLVSGVTPESRRTYSQ